jgi:repressor LexA
MWDLTDKQLKILYIIKDFIIEHGYSPTVREIGEIAGLRSSATVDTYLKILQKKGYIIKVEGKMRTIRIVKR